MSSSLWARVADELDPPPPAEHELSPLAFACRTVRTETGPYRWAPHLALMEEACLQALAGAGRLLLEVAIRHGKTKFLVALVAWYLCTNPDKRVIWGSHTADFAARRGREIRELVTRWGPELFGVYVSRKSEAANRWDIAGHAGGLIAVGVGGTPIGEGADLEVIDDPLKGFEAAMSPVQRGKVNDWVTGTMFGRLSPGASVIMALARWHHDDPGGLLLREDPEHWTSLRLPGLCDDPATDPLGRREGEALWPQSGYDEAEHARRRHEMSITQGEFVWLAQVQQRATKRGGGKFPEDRWKVIGAAQVPVETRWCRGWDLAATEDGGDWTVGALVGWMPDGRWVVASVIRGQWTGHVWRQMMRAAAESDPEGTRVQLPQDPGQSGKDQAQQVVTHMSGFDAGANPVTGSKEIRANSYAAQQQAGNVLLVDGPWIGAFIAEHTDFPRGTHDDQVDAAATAFNWLAAEVGNGEGPRLRGTL